MRSLLVVSAVALGLSCGPRYAPPVEKVASMRGSSQPASSVAPTPAAKPGVASESTSTPEDGEPSGPLHRWLAPSRVEASTVVVEITDVAPRCAASWIPGKPKPESGRHLLVTVVFTNKTERLASVRLSRAFVRIRTLRPNKLVVVDIPVVVVDKPLEDLSVMGADGQPSGTRTIQVAPHASAEAVVLRSNSVPSWVNDMYHVYDVNLILVVEKERLEVTSSGRDRHVFY